MPQAGRAPLWPARAAWAGLAAAAGLSALRRLSDPDLPWHLAVGRSAAAGRGPLAADDFSYTFAGRPVPYEYASDLVLYLTQRVAGPWGLHLLAAAAAALLVWLLALRPGKDARPAALLLACVAVASLSPLLILRPALLGFPFFAAALLCLDRFRGGGTARWLWALVPLQLAWANVHAFAILGAAAAAGYGAFAALCRLAGGRWPALLPPADGRRWPVAAAAGLAAAAATCLSAFGPGIFLGPWRVAGHEAFITEWAPASWGLFWAYDPALGLLVLLVAAALVWGRGESGGRCPDLFELSVLAASACLMLLRFRLFPFFVMAAAPFAAKRLWPWLRGRPWLPAGLLAAALLAPAAVALRTEVPWGAGFDPARFPEGALRFAAASRPQGPVFNDLAFGGAIIWRLYPQVRVFIDGRTSYLYPPDFLRLAWQAQHDPAAFDQLRSRYGFQWALVDAQEGAEAARPLAASGDWAMLYVDDAAAVYADVQGPNRGLMFSGYQVLRHLTPWPLLLRQELPAAAVARDADLALAQAPDSARARLWSAAAALRRGDLVSARGHRDRLKALAPRHPDLPLLDRLLSGGSPQG